MDLFRALGDRIGSQWCATGSFEEFTKVSERVLRENSLEGVDTSFILDWASHQSILPKQLNFQNAFGEPPLTVYSGDGFYLEILFWFTSRTAIHGHGFAGAFQVLSGHSLQTEYDFTNCEEICEGVNAGRLGLRSFRLIAPGDVAAISAGDRFIHSVAHLGLPSITLVARTIESRGVKQYSYSRSGLAWLPFHLKEDISRRVALVGTLKRSKPNRYQQELLKMVRGGGPHRCLMTMLHLVHAKSDDELMEEILEVGCVDSGQRDLLRNAVQEMARRKRIWNAIRNFPESERLRIALAELFGSEANALQELKNYYPELSAENTIDRWQEEISL